MQAHLVGASESDLRHTRRDRAAWRDAERRSRCACRCRGRFAQPIAISSATLHGSYVPATHDILIDQLGVTGTGLQFDTSGRITLIDKQSPVDGTEGPHRHAAACAICCATGRSAPRTARATGSARNIFGGSVGPIVFETHFPAGDARSGQAARRRTADDVSDRQRRSELRHRTDASDRGAAATPSSPATASRSTYRSARIGPLAVSKGHAVVPDLSAPDSPGDIHGACRRVDDATS